MAGYSCAFQMILAPNKPPMSRKYGSPPKASLSSAVEPLLRDLARIPTSIDVPKIMKESSRKLLDAFVEHVFEFVDQPYLPSQSNFAPVEEIQEAIHLTGVQGRIPDDFPQGVYIRNGANPIHGGLKSAVSIFGKSSQIWVEGEGMVHALYFNKHSSANNCGSMWSTMYNNKYIQTNSFKIERERKKPSFLPSVEGETTAVLAAFLLNSLRYGMVNKNHCNTNVFEHSEKYYSIAENDMPLQINVRTLETLGDWNEINQVWNRPFTSHPKD